MLTFVLTCSALYSVTIVTGEGSDCGSNRLYRVFQNKCLIGSPGSQFKKSFYRLLLISVGKTLFTDNFEMFTKRLALYTCAILKFVHVFRKNC